MTITQTTKEIYSGYNVIVDMIIRENNTAAPAAGDAEWGTDSSVLFVGTNFKSGASTEVTDKHGLGQQRPYATKQGYVGYTFSFDSLYTVDTYKTDNNGATYDILELIDNDTTIDLRVRLLDGIGEDSASSVSGYIVLGGCKLDTSDFEVGTDSDATSALSGRAESRTITPGA